MLTALIYLFILLTVLSIPAIAIYGSSDGLVNYKNYMYTKYTMGNMGYASSECF
jgi:hypothetical protein